MNAVEIDKAISKLIDLPFDRDAFAFAFLEAFGNKKTTIDRLKKGSSNASDIADGVLQRNNIHLAVCAEGATTATLADLKASPATGKGKVKFILATDGVQLEAEDLNSGELVICEYKEFPDRFGFFLTLAGIVTTPQIRENAFDIRATRRLNNLYVALLKDNPDWGMADRSHAMNHFMARLIFCFFAEDTDIFHEKGLFTATITQMSARDSSDTHEVIGEIFRAMNTKREDRDRAGLPRWAAKFPYVNGGLFSDDHETPRFSKIARSYLSHIGGLDWQKINPDIFGSMIQAIADDGERDALGLHYTSVPNILKVLNPLFLDDLRTKLAEAGDNPRKLLNLRKRMAKIRIFDPACGSGNFLVIAYKEMRGLEAIINERRQEAHLRSEIPLTNFRGIELRDFPTEIARLALIIAEYQSDVVYRGQKEALAEFLPLGAMNWIFCGNALRLDWRSICPPLGVDVAHRADDLLHTPLDQAEVSFENEGGETYICGNPPYKGSQTQGREQKDDLASVFKGTGVSSKQIDYVGGWFIKAANYAKDIPADSAFVSTNSICQGRIVPLIWPLIDKTGAEISFAYTSFKWANLASHNAGVTVAIIGLSHGKNRVRRLYSEGKDGEAMIRAVPNITPYLTTGQNIIVRPASKSMFHLPEMAFGNMSNDGGHLLLSPSEMQALGLTPEQKSMFIRKAYGGKEFIQGIMRYCIWIEDHQLEAAKAIPAIKDRIEMVRKARLASKRGTTRDMADYSHQFSEIRGIGVDHTIIIPRVSSENRDYLQVGILDGKTIVTDSAFALYDAPLWTMALIASRLHLAWVATICGKLETRYRYSKILGWNSFPVPKLTENNKVDLSQCAENILLAREAHFPVSIADLYDPEKMPADLRRAHEDNDEVLERIYLGRRFNNDTERLEVLLALYAKKLAANEAAQPIKKKAS